MFLLVDNYDSFTWNIYHYIALNKVKVDVYRNDKINIKNIHNKNYKGIIFSPGPLVFKLKKLLENYTTDDYLLLTGDPAIIGIACSIVADRTNGKFNLLK